jgi:hypothetical protein
MEWHLLELCVVVNGELLHGIMGVHLYRSYYTNWAILNATFSVLLMLMLCLRLYPQFLFCTKRYVLLTSSSATVLTDRRNVTVRSKERCRRGREKLCEIWRMDDVELGWEKLTVRTVRLKLLTGPFRLVTYCTADGYTAILQKAVL